MNRNVLYLKELVLIPLGEEEGEALFKFIVRLYPLLTTN
jgi:hypothetical protein